MLIHIGSDIGQRHFVEVREFLLNLPEATDPPASSVCYLGNISFGVQTHLRHHVEATALPMLAAVGLKSVFMNVLRRQNMRTVRLVSMLNNGRVYLDGDLAL